MAEHALTHARTTAVVQDRTTGAAVCPLPDTDVGIRWERRLDRVSRAQVDIGTRGIDECSERLAAVGTWGQELAIYRAGELVWIGPLVDITDDPQGQSVTLSAEDRMTWTEERVLLIELDYSGQGVRDSSQVFFELFGQADSASPIGLTLAEPRRTGVLVDRNIAIGTEIASAMRTVARDALNWTVSGDRLYCAPLDDGYDIPPYEALTNVAWEDNGVRLIEAGKQLVTHVIVTGSNDTLGIFPNPIEPDPFWGLHIVSERDRAVLTNSDARVRAQEIYESYNTTTPIYATSNRSLGPGFAGSIWDFVPGRRFVIAVEGTCKTYEIEQRLNALRVSADSGFETDVRVSFDPPGDRR